MIKNRFKRHPKITLILFSMLLLLGLDIILTRGLIFYFGKNFSNKKEIVQKHEVYHHTFKPLKKAKVWGKSLFTNSLGFKDKENREINLKKSKYRVLFMGDSFTEGIYLKYEDTFVGMVDSALGNKSIEILNGGRSGYSPIIYYTKTKYLLEINKLEFDEMILFLDLSDFENEVRHYELSIDQRVISRNKSNKNLGKDIDQFFTIKNLKKGIRKNTTVTFHISNFIKDMIKYEPKKTILTKLNTNSNWDRYSKKELSEENIEFYKGLSHMKTYMNLLVELLKQHNICITIAVYPWPAQIYGKQYEEWTDFWNDWANENNVNYLDYFPDFINLKDSLTVNEILKKYYIPNDFHFNRAGNKMLSIKVLDQLKQKL